MNNLNTIFNKVNKQRVFYAVQDKRLLRWFIQKFRIAMLEALLDVIHFASPDIIDSEFMLFVILFCESRK